MDSDLGIIMEPNIGNTSRDALADGLIGLLKPAVEEVDERVRAVRSVDQPRLLQSAGCLHGLTSPKLGLT